MGKYTNKLKGRNHLKWVYKIIVINHKGRLTTVRVLFLKDDMGKMFKTVMYKDGNRLGKKKVLDYSKHMADTLDDTIDQIDKYKKGILKKDEVFLSNKELRKIMNGGKGLI